MGDDKFTWLIRNVYSDEKIHSDIFVIGGCSWRVVADYSKVNERLSLSVEVADAENLPCGWRIRSEFSFTIVNQISEEFSQLEDMFSDLTETQEWFDHKTTVCGCASSFPLGKLNDKYGGGFILDGEVKIVAKLKVVEAIGKPLLHKEETIDVHGFPVFPSEVKFVRRIFKKHPDIAVDFSVRDVSRYLKRAIIFVLICLIKNLRKPIRKMTRSCLFDAHNSLVYMINCRLKVGWLEKKLKDVKEKKAKLRKKSKAKVSL